MHIDWSRYGVQRTQNYAGSRKALPTVSCICCIQPPDEGRYQRRPSFRELQPCDLAGDLRHLLGNPLVHDVQQQQHVCLQMELLFVTDAAFHLLATPPTPLDPVLKAACAQPAHLERRLGQHDHLFQQ